MTYSLASLSRVVREVQVAWEKAHDKALDSAKEKQLLSDLRAASDFAKEDCAKGSGDGLQDALGKVSGDARSISVYEDPTFNQYMSQIFKNLGISEQDVNNAVKKSLGHP